MAGFLSNETTACHCQENAGSCPSMGTFILSQTVIAALAVKLTIAMRSNGVIVRMQNLTDDPSRVPRRLLSR